MAKIKGDKKSLTPEIRLSRIVVSISRNNERVVHFDVESYLIDDSDMVIAAMDSEESIIVRDAEVMKQSITLDGGIAITLDQAMDALDTFFTEQYEKKKSK
jgi:hypothetical protein